MAWQCSKIDDSYLRKRTCMYSTVYFHVQKPQTTTKTESAVFGITWEGTKGWNRMVHTTSMRTYSNTTDFPIDNKQSYKQIASYNPGRNIESEDFPENAINVLGDIHLVGRIYDDLSETTFIHTSHRCFLSMSKMTNYPSLTTPFMCPFPALSPHLPNRTRPSTCTRSNMYVDNPNQLLYEEWWTKTRNGKILFNFSLTQTASSASTGSWTNSKLTLLNTHTIKSHALSLQFKTLLSTSA